MSLGRIGARPSEPDCINIIIIILHIINNKYTVSIAIERRRGTQTAMTLAARERDRLSRRFLLATESSEKSRWCT